jgi:flagellar biosynthesis protein FlhF
MTQIKEEVGDDAFIVSMTEASGRVEIEVGVDDGLPMVRLEHPITDAILEPTADVTHKNDLMTLLLEHGVSKANAQLIIKGASPVAKTEMSADRRIGHGLDTILECNSLLPQRSNVIAICGATGVGKTTTIAKIAARLKQSFEMKIGLIAADTYRVGAGFHLQTYASLMNMPFRQIQSSGIKGAKELKDAVDQFSQYDLVLIDTSGCGPREKGRIEDLEKSLSLIPQAEKMLVLPAPSNDFDLHAAARSFAKIDYSRVILSKVDESGFIGPVINTLIGLKKPLAFIASGQRVPEDIEPASNRRLGWMLTRAMQ